MVQKHIKMVFIEPQAADGRTYGRTDGCTDMSTNIKFRDLYTIPWTAKKTDSVIST